jgi:hypothetical protein
VDGGNFRETAKRFDHTVGDMALDFDHHDAAHRQVDSVRAQNDRIAQNIA